MGNYGTEKSTRNLLIRFNFGIIAKIAKNIQTINFDSIISFILKMAWLLIFHEIYQIHMIFSIKCTLNCNKQEKVITQLKLNFQHIENIF